MVNCVFAIAISFLLVSAKDKLRVCQMKTLINPLQPITVNSRSDSLQFPLHCLRCRQPDGFQQYRRFLHNTEKSSRRNRDAIRHF